METKHYRKGQIVTLKGKRYRLTQDLTLLTPIAKSGCVSCLLIRNGKGCNILKLIAVCTNQGK